MTVCQGCGRACSSDLCCPTCAHFERSSFFCSQECFSSNWRDHGRLHAILQQQRKMSEFEMKEKKALGMSAASSALSAMQEYLRDRVSFTASSPKRVSVDTKTISEASDFKDHNVSYVDKMIGRNGVLKGFRVMALAAFLLFIIFYRVNSLLSEIPELVERKAAQKRIVATGNGINEAFNVISSRDDEAGIIRKPDSVIGLVEVKKKTDDMKEQESEIIKSLRGEIESLKEQISIISKNKTLDLIDSSPHELISRPAVVDSSDVGMVRDEVPFRVLKQELGIVRQPERI